MNNAGEFSRSFRGSEWKNHKSQIKHLFESRSKAIAKAPKISNRNVRIGNKKLISITNEIEAVYPLHIIRSSSYPCWGIGECVTKLSEARRLGESLTCLIKKQLTCVTKFDVTCGGVSFISLWRLTFNSLIGIFPKPWSHELTSQEECDNNLNFIDRWTSPKCVLML